ncbi:LPS export ABC transporter permease LptG [Thermodesulfobacteriota bacterium]
MRILDKYIISEFMKVFILCAAGFTLVFLLVEIPDKIKYYYQYKPPTWLMIKYFLVKTPGYLFYVIPLGILLGGMLSIFMLARNSEIIAMQANGVAALTIARPVLMAGLVASVLMFVANETVIPWSNWYSEYIQDCEIARKCDKTFFRGDEIWMRSPRSITNIRHFEKSDNTLENVTIVRWDDNYRFTERLNAAKAKWMGGGWTLFGVNVTRRTQDGGFTVAAVPVMPAVFDKPPEEFGRVERLAKEMNLTELGDYIEKLRGEGHQPTRYLVDWHDKIAFPWVCLIMAALSVPFAVKVGPRTGGVALGLSLSIAVAFSYWIVHTVFVALGHGGYVPAMAAAWATNVVFGLGCAILLLHAET